MPPAIGEHEPAGDAGMANGHLQRDEAAITVAEHDRLVAAGSVLHHLRHPVGDRGKTTADGFRAAKPGSSGTITRNVRASAGTMASKLARSDSSE